MNYKPFFLCVLALNTLFTTIKTDAMDNKKNVLLTVGSTVLAGLFFKFLSSEKSNDKNTQDLMKLLKTDDPILQKFKTFFEQACGDDKNPSLVERVSQLEETFKKVTDNFENYQKKSNRFSFEDPTKKELKKIKKNIKSNKTYIEGIEKYFKFRLKEGEEDKKTFINYLGEFQEKKKDKKNTLKKVKKQQKSFENLLKRFNLLESELINNEILNNKTWKWKITNEKPDFLEDLYEQVETLGTRVNFLDFVIGHKHSKHSLRVLKKQLKQEKKRRRRSPSF